MDLVRLGHVAAFAIAALGCGGAQSAVARPDAASDDAPRATEAASGRVGSHGMIVVGAPDRAFLSHIPMFAGPHDVQLVVGGSFAPLAAGGALPASFSEELFTFVPDRMSLDALRTGTLRELRGTLFSGNFEAGGRPLPGQVRFAVSNVMHQHVLDPAAPAAAALTYLVFGTRETTLAAHRLSSSPGFDELLRVTLEGPDAPTDEELARGVTITIAGSPDEPSRRLGARTAPAEATAGGRRFTIATKTALSCLEGPEFTSACR